MAIKKSLFSLICFTLILAACAPGPDPSLGATPSPEVSPTPNPSVTPSPTLPSPTWTPRPTLFFATEYVPLTPYPTYEPAYPQVSLPGGLKIEEYETTSSTRYETKYSILLRHPERGGELIYPNGGYIDGKFFEATLNLDFTKHSALSPFTIHATLDGKEMATIVCGNMAAIMPYVPSAWVYGKHWIIQTHCYAEPEIFWDGQSLNEIKGYKESVGLQLMDEKLFYVFKRDKQLGVFYDGEEVMLPYDDFLIAYCCDSADPIRQYEHMVTFMALRGEKWYYLAIGLFDR